MFTKQKTVKIKKGKRKQQFALVVKICESYKKTLKIGRRVYILKIERVGN